MQFPSRLDAEQRAGRHVALEVLDIVEELLPNIQTTGQYFRTRLAELPGVVAVRGEGLMLGAELATEGNTVVDEAMEQGLLVNCTRKHLLACAILATQQNRRASSGN